MIMKKSPLLVPRPLLLGDRVAIVSPAGIARAADVFNASCAIEKQGWEPVVMPHALGRHGTFSGTPDERFSDLRDAMTDRQIRAVVCSRGGYGAVHLLDRIDPLPLRDDPKWLVGFSDITALHALMTRHGIASVHGPMTKYIGADEGENVDFRALCAILRGEMPVYSLPSHPLNREGEATGRFAGGNLAVMGGLVSTSYDMLRPDTVLFIEDIAEPIYKVERQLEQLRMSGVLPRLKALLTGAFTDYRPDANYATMEQMIADKVSCYGYPVAFGIPAGHGGRSLPMIEGAEVEIKITPDETVLRFIK